MKTAPRIVSGEKLKGKEHYFYNFVRYEDNLTFPKYKIFPIDTNNIVQEPESQDRVRGLNIYNFTIPKSNLEYNEFTDSYNVYFQYLNPSDIFMIQCDDGNQSVVFDYCSVKKGFITLSLVKAINVNITIVVIDDEE